MFLTNFESFEYLEYHPKWCGQPGGGIFGGGIEVFGINGNIDGVIGIVFGVYKLGVTSEGGGTEKFGKTGGGVSHLLLGGNVGTCAAKGAITGTGDACGIIEDVSTTGFGI